MHTSESPVRSAAILGRHSKVGLYGVRGQDRARRRSATAKSWNGSFRALFKGLMGLRGHALALTSTNQRDQSRAPSLRRRYGRHRHRYYEPLGLPPDTRPFRTRLIGPAFARREPPGRASPVPCRTVGACPPQYPGGVLHPSGSHECSLLPSPRHDRLGHPSLSGAYVSGLQGSLHAGPASLLPSQESCDPIRALDSPLRPTDLSVSPDSATRRSGAYRGGTSTREHDTTFRTHHGRHFTATRGRGKPR